MSKNNVHETSKFRNAAEACFSEDVVPIETIHGWITHQQQGTLHLQLWPTGPVKAGFIQGNLEYTISRHTRQSDLI